MNRRIAYIQYTNPGAYPPLEHSSMLLANAGWSVLFLGTHSLTADDLEFPSHPGIRVDRLSACRAGLRQKAHYLWFALRTLTKLARWKAAWVYASDPLSAPIALCATYLPGVKVVYHEHDSPAPRGGKGRILLAARRRLARRAALCVLPNGRRAALFVADTGAEDVATVWNCPRRDEVSSARTDEGERVVMLYHGSIVPERLPLAVVQALAMLPARVSLEVVGYETIGGRGHSERLMAVARSLNIADRVSFLGAMPRYRLLEHCRRAHIGLALMPRDSSDLNMREMVGASNKAFDYLACGLALLVSDLPSWRHTFLAPGYGIACDPCEAASIARSVQALLDQPGEIRAMGERGRRRIVDEWNYEAQFAAVAARLESETLSR